jgi:hypothetical protein
MHIPDGKLLQCLLALQEGSRHVIPHLLQIIFQLFNFFAVLLVLGIKKFLVCCILLRVFVEAIREDLGLFFVLAE